MESMIKIEIILFIYSLTEEKEGKKWIIDKVVVVGHFQKNKERTKAILPCTYISSDIHAYTEHHTIIIQTL